MSRKYERIKIGEIFGKWTVIEKSVSKFKSGKKTNYLCKCECGNQSVVGVGSLRSGDSKSCGCARKALRKSKGHSSKRHKFGGYRKDAKDRGLSFELTFEEFASFICCPCHYCGADPAPYNVFYNRNGSMRSNRAGTSPEWAKEQWVMFNGIDRVENSIGYIAGNCVPCCDKCNWWKAAFSKGQFLHHVKKIFEFSSAKGFI